MPELSGILNLNLTLQRLKDVHNFRSPVEPEKYIKCWDPLLNSIMIIICGYMNLLWK